MCYCNPNIRTPYCSSDKCQKRAKELGIDLYRPKEGEYKPAMVTFSKHMYYLPDVNGKIEIFGPETIILSKQDIKDMLSLYKEREKE